MAIDFGNLHVSKETYEQTMHDAVNAFYMHAQNDPTITQEDVNEMAERALEAIDEFAAQEAAAQGANEAAGAAEAQAETIGGPANAEETGLEAGPENDAPDNGEEGPGNDTEGGPGNDGGIE